MCGIFGYIGNKTNAAEIVLEGLKALEYRGYDSWGVAVCNSRKIEHQKKIGKIGDAVVKLSSSGFGIGHTRWATHGGVTQENAHPHVGCSETLAVVHNGIVENHQELKEALDPTHIYESETDTEVVTHLLEEELKSEDFIGAVKNTFKKLRGLNAIGVLSESGELAVAKNGSPIVLGIGKDGYFLASDASAILPHTKKVVFLEDGQMALLNTKGLTLFDISTGKKIREKITILDWAVSDVSLGENKHFMIKEINEQPFILTNIAETYKEQVKKFAEVIKASYGAFFLGAGTAGNAALAGSYLFSRIAQRHVNFDVASEFEYTTHFLTPKSLVIALSQSGETIDVVEPLNKAKKKGAKTAALVNVLGSTIYRMVDHPLLLGAGPEKSVCATKSYTAKLAVLTLLAYELIGKYEIGRKLILSAAQEIEKILTDASIENIAKLAKKISSHDHLFTIGRGLNYPSALESALKIKEVSYIHAEGFAGGELKHGVIALIEKGTPTLCFAPLDETYDAIISGATEIKARGGFIIGISPRNHSVFDVWFKVGDVGDASPIVNAVIPQILAYNLALEKNLDPDKPRNLAKSVTVK